MPPPVRRQFSSWQAGTITHQHTKNMESSIDQHQCDNDIGD